MTSISDKLHLLALANAVLCAGIAWVCLCRIAALSKRSRLLFRALYSLMGAAALGSSLQPLLFGEWPGVSELMVNAVLLAFLASGMKTWREGAPKYTTRPDWLDTDQLQHVVGGKGQS
jgi:hypothetical protein